LNFPIGSWVYVKLQPYKQTSLSGSKYHKLAKRFYGPYQTLEKIGPVAYKVELLSQSKIHNVFHCSWLKFHEGPPPTHVDQLPPDSVDNNPLLTPLAILDFKTIVVDGSPMRFALVQWNGLPPDDTSWENWSELKSLYDLEDKVLAEGDGIVTCDPITRNTRPKRMVNRPAGWFDFIH